MSRCQKCFYSLRDLALSRPVCTFFEAYWQEKFNGNVLPLRVGTDVATINDVMGVIEILSSRREYTKASQFGYVLLKGKRPKDFTLYGPPPPNSASKRGTLVGKSVRQLLLYLARKENVEKYEKILNVTQEEKKKRKKKRE